MRAKVATLAVVLGFSPVFAGLPIPPDEISTQPRFAQFVQRSMRNTPVGLLHVVFDYDFRCSFYLFDFHCLGFEPALASGSSELIETNQKLARLILDTLEQVNIYLLAHFNMDVEHFQEWLAKKNGAEIRALRPFDEIDFSVSIFTGADGGKMELERLALPKNNRRVLHIIYNRLGQNLPTDLEQSDISADEMYKIFQ